MAKLKFYCSLCGRTLRSGVCNCFTSCGHFICDSCRSFNPGDEISCPVCRASAGTLEIQDDPMRMPSSVRHFFQDPATLIMQGIDVLKFQRAHQNNRETFIKQQLTAAAQIQEENAQLKRQLQEAKASMVEMQREVSSLRQKLSDVLQSSHSRSRSQERLLSAEPSSRQTPATPVRKPFSMQGKLLQSSSHAMPGTPRLNTPILRKENMMPQFSMGTMNLGRMTPAQTPRLSAAKMLPRSTTPDRARRFDLLNSSGGGTPH
ncbi:Zinc finger RING-type [Carpediemonas membranifera]|uniref:Zinc finger RING-type n=1 Tax=Carpediemonas membranifera TaxID=201153 RepID=A0A8J6E1N3_9EUKA|nr:Zinc finger RING-type [Carpediemonas membranifera]|eukprot:KAG9396579.1 Zinc finger RING-type [Carpediemonas membranifera]